MLTFSYDFRKLVNPSLPYPRHSHSLRVSGLFAPQIPSMQKGGLILQLVLLFLFLYSTSLNDKSIQTDIPSCLLFRSSNIPE